jgi:AraC-like DNA-binding protein
MNSVLDSISDWEEAARRSQYLVSHLATNCNVSVRQLRNYMREKFGIAPHVWLLKKRLLAAPSLLAQGHSVKEVSAALGFHQQSHFCRQFKRLYKMSPTSFRANTRAPVCVSCDADSDKQLPI